MTTISPFGTLDYHDESAIHQWQMAHDMRHITYVREMARRGKAVTTTILSGKIDHDWHGRHATAHAALKLAMGNNPLYDTIGLSTGWNSEKEFYDWHERHTRLHRYTDEQLGLVM